MRRIDDRKEMCLTPGVESAVTTNGEKSAEAIVGGNSEGLNEIQFMSFTIVRRFLRTVCDHEKKWIRLET